MTATSRYRQGLEVSPVSPAPNGPVRFTFDVVRRTWQPGTDLERIDILGERSVVAGSWFAARALLTGDGIGLSELTLVARADLPPPVDAPVADRWQALVRTKRAYRRRVK